MCSWCSVHVASSDKLFHVMHNKKTRFYIIYSEYGGKQYKKEEKTERAKITHCESTSERNAQKRRKIQKKNCCKSFFFLLCTIAYVLCLRNARVNVCLRKVYYFTCWWFWYERVWRFVSLKLHFTDLIIAKFLPVFTNHFYSSKWLKKNSVCFVGKSIKNPQKSHFLVVENFWKFVDWSFLSDDQ